jgi:RND superfamily putative drug exporter
VLALKAAVLNLVSLAAVFGVVVLVFQEGHGSSLWHVMRYERSTPGSR